MALGSMVLIKGNSILSQMDGEWSRVVSRLVSASDVVVKTPNIGITWENGSPMDFSLAWRAASANVASKRNTGRRRSITRGTRIGLLF